MICVERGNDMKKCIAFVLILSFLLALTPGVGAMTEGTAKGIFDKLDLSQMRLVQKAVAEGDTALAQQELLNYYTEKFRDKEPQPGSTIKNAMVYLATKNAFAFSEPYLNYADIKSTEYTKYSINLVGNKTGNYVLSMLDKTVGEIIVASREDTSRAPKLVIICKDGTTETLTATADAYVRGGQYGSWILGTAKTLYAHDDYADNLPYGNNTKRIYIRFDAARIPSNADTVRLEFYAKCSGGTESVLRLHAFGAYATAWTESNLSWSYLMNSHSIGHYSWNGMPGGFDWKEPAGVPNQWVNYNGRFYEVTSLVQQAVKEGKTSSNYDLYMNTAKDIMLDFIADAGAGYPWLGEDLDSANRLLEFPYIYKQLLAGGFITPEENATILTWVWEETEFLSSQSYLFSPDNLPLSDLALYHGFRHLTGFYQGGGFFSEFKAAETWRKNYEARQNYVIHSLVLEDGAYNTISFGYPSEMVNCGVVLLTAMNEAGDYATAYTVKTKIIALAKYMIECSLPDGTLPYWGQGAPSSPEATVHTVLDAIGDTMDGDPTVAELRAFVNGTEMCDSDTTAQFDVSKIVVDRAGWSENDTMLFMNAKNGGNHGHRDALALLMYYEGRQLLTDTGMTSYDSTHGHFNWQNSTTRSHNTVEIDGKAQTWYQNLEDVTHMGDISYTANGGLTTITAWSDANHNDTSTKSLSMDGVINNLDFHSTDFRHYRDVSFVKALGDLVIVTDKIVPGDAETHSYTQNWHFAPYSNATVTGDSYGTGKTAYATGPNLIITQATETTATVRNGYDATAANSPTKYLEYSRTASGTVTYQTVLYPVSAGANATVEPTKLTMDGTGDETALAMEIRLADTAQPELGKVYHYHSFEEIPTARNFGVYTTDGATAILAMNQNDEITYAGISDGSFLNQKGKTILSVSAPVTDLSITLEGKTLSVEGSDPKLAFLQIKVNFDGQTVKTVLKNGEQVPFTQGTDGTVTIGGTYLLTHFKEGDILTGGMDWSANCASANVDTGTGFLTGIIDGHDPSAYTKAVPSYELKAGDVVELRIKNAVTSGTYTALQLFYMTDGDTGFSGSKCMGHSASTYPADEYVTVRLSFPKTVVGQTLTALRIDMVGSVKTDPALGTYSIDYIYVGPAEGAPSSYEGNLLFCFSNTAEDELRYTGKNYGDRNYDEGFWVVNTNRCNTPIFDGENMILEIAETTDNYSATGVAPFVQTGDESLALANAALDYSPKAGDYVQIRFAMYNCAVATGNPAVRLYFNTDAGGTMTDKVTKNISPTDLTTGEYVVVTIPMAEATAYETTRRLRGLRLQFPNICSEKGKTGIIIIDYIYLGSKEALPVQNCTVTFRNYDGTILAIREQKIGESAVYQGETPTRPFDGNQHYTFAGWDKLLDHLTADVMVTARFTGTSHSYDYTSVGVDTHRATCMCGYGKDESHSYENGICICGETEVKEPIEESKWKIGHTLNLASDISVNLAVSKSLLAGFDMDTVYILAEIDLYTENEKTGTKTVKIFPVEQGNYYYFTLTGLTAVNMNDRIRSVLHGTKDGQEYYSATDDYSIADYAYSQMNKTAGVPDKLKVLCAELLRYGAKAQIYKNYRVNDLADSKMTDTHKAYLSDMDAVVFGNTNKTLDDLSNASIKWVGKSLSLDSKVCLKFIFSKGSYAGDIADLTLHVSYTDTYGATKEVVLTGAELYNANLGYYAFTLDTMLAAELRSVVSVQVYSGNTPVSCTLQYSADTYGNNKTGTLLDVCKALFAYSDSAKSYFAG